MSAQRVSEDRPRRHKGDIMSPEKRSAVMARIRGTGTGPERALGAEMAALGLEWESHARDLAGRPDFVFRDARIAVFVDGDFWHGWHFHEWRDKLTVAWEAKILANRQRDSRNQRALRAEGWVVVRLWEHQIDQGVRRCARRVARLVGTARDSALQPGIDVSPEEKPGQPAPNLVDSPK